MKNWTLLALLTVLFGGAIVTFAASSRAKVSAGSPYSVFLPYVGLVDCASFTDDFSDPTSGWPIIDDASSVTDYIDGEYSIFMKNGATSYVRFAPTPCELEDYFVTVETRWEGPVGFVNGVIFGANESRSDYYIATVNYETDRVQVRRVVNGIPDLPLLGYTQDVSGTTSVGVIVDSTNDSYMVVVDGVEQSIPKVTLEGRTGVGVAAGVVEANKEVRFDNFEYVPYEGSP